MGEGSARMRKSFTTERSNPAASPELTPESLLENYYKKAKEIREQESKQKRRKRLTDIDRLRRLEPDAAMRKLAETISEIIFMPVRFSPGYATVSEISYSPPDPDPLPTSIRFRKLHLRAVDLFYKTYAEDNKGAGRPRLPLDRCLLLYRKRYNEKLTYLQIAKEMGVPSNTPEERRRATELIRQRTRTAKKWLTESGHFKPKKLAP